MQNRWVLNGSIAVLAALPLAACAGKTPEPEAAESEAAAESPEPAKAESTQAEPAKQDEPEELPDKTPKQLLTEEGTVFAFSFPDSDVGKKAEEDCTKKSKDDPQKRAQCMQKARDRYPEEGIRFKKDPDGNWWYITYGRLRGKPVDLHRIQFEFGEEKDKQVTLKLKGPDKGAKRGSVPSEVVIQIPDEYSIQIDDPAKGTVVYKTRVGATDPD